MAADISENAPFPSAPSTPGLGLTMNGPESNRASVDASITSTRRTQDALGKTLPVELEAPPSQSPMESPVVQKLIHLSATARLDALLAAAVALAAVIYMILGRLGLLIIGALGGAGGFVAWEARNPGVARAIKREKGIDLIDRIWQEMKDTKTSQDEKAAEDAEDLVLKGFDDFQPETREALAGLVDAVIRDYVKWWYSPIIPGDHSFPLACRKTLTSFLLSVSNHLYRKRPADAFLDLLTNSSSIAMVFMSELALAFSEMPPGSQASAADTVYEYLANNPESRLASLLNQKQQAAKFEMVAGDLLDFLERSSYQCDPVRVFLREVLASSVLETMLQTCSKAEWINGWIVYLLEGGEPDLSQAIDVGMQTGRESGQNLFSDLDGNVGNISLIKPSKSSIELDRGRRKESSAHKKKLSKADEELEEAMEEMKRMNKMIARDDARRRRASLIGEAEGKLVSPAVPPESTTASKSDTAAESIQKTPAPVQRTSTRSSQEHGSPMGTSDGFSSRSEVVATPVTPGSAREASSQNSSPPKDSGDQFTNFDQIVCNAPETQEDDEAPKRAALTLHNASFTLHDDTTDKGRIRSKPNWDYLIQVEPSVNGHSGWMIVRRYTDFETLHEILRRIAVVSGASAFTELHKELPSWKIHTRESLRGEMERYLRDACWYQSLAESEGMKRFLEKSQGHTHTGKNFAWESVGKNMLDVLTTAPKGAMEGGKTIVGGVTGVFGNFPGLSRKPTSQSIDLTPNSNRLSISTPPRMESKSPVRSERASIDSQQSSVISTQPGKVAPMERRTSFQSLMGEGEADVAKRGRMERLDSYTSTSASARPSREHSRASSLAPMRSPSSTSMDQLKLPPPPDEIPDDYGSPTSPGHMHIRTGDSTLSSASHRNSLSVGNMSTSSSKQAKPKRQYTKLSEQETRVAVELIFAVINEMYTLSSAWNIRRTLLTAAKSYLLRPGNPSLLAVQKLMQSSVLDANSSDAGIAYHLRKVRENTMPTEEERAAWPTEMTPEEKEQLASKARKLLIQSGVPAALMGVMGQAATGEALGRVFDCLQIEEVARGLIFGLIFQTARVFTH